jgi:6-pyruvoyltetrahydropterin/6-carboxytetrahydropterin synthase
MPSKTVVKKRSARSLRAKSPRVLTGTVFITRQVHFNSAHRLYNPTKSQAWNTKQYGLCTNPHWHGHNYVLEVTLRGRPDPETGYIVDLGELKRILHKAVVDKCDHRNLNDEVDFLRGIIPSTENLVIAFWQQIEPLIPAGKLHCVRLYETPRNFAEYFGQDDGAPF